MPAVDFNAVRPEHHDIDKRLGNWGRWSLGRGGSDCSPMFRLYRPDNYEREPSGNPLDPIDAQRVQKGVTALPTPHRLALSWCYISRNNPRKAAQLLGESLEGLARLIEHGRTMLINRKV